MKQHRGIISYTILLIFIAVGYRTLPYVWQFIPLGPHSEMLKAALLIIGLIITIQFCFRILMGFEKAIAEFTYDVKKKLRS
ncbi:MAG: hypothetical protein L6243_03535 [Candidatus Altiarchaeales archaeon]|nr:hypothetical protein [Candidatus Altiarchaeota archaeon]MBU4436701.1 hypothetical protein [Candidatus Altiarchaeota archaeon]MCG2782641.1 hypothetical protein [Candidatus Altiarchaeales archaeon]